jgi:hypothetical protein
MTPASVSLLALTITINRMVVLLSLGSRLAMAGIDNSPKNIPQTFLPAFLDSLEVAARNRLDATGGP